MSHPQGGGLELAELISFAELELKSNLNLKMSIELNSKLQNEELELSLQICSELD